MISGTTCTKHIGKTLDYYCADCKKIVCVSCIFESHRFHDCKDVISVDEEFRKTIEKNAEKISTYANEMLSMRKYTEMRKADFLKEIVEEENAILKRNQQLKSMIDEHTKSLLEELSLLKSAHLKEIETAMEEINRCCTILRSFEACCTELRLKGSASDICSSVDELLVRADEMEKDHWAFINFPRQSVEVSFLTTDLQEVLEKSNRNIVGQIKETTTQFQKYATVVGLSNGRTMTKDVIQINLHRPNKISVHQEIPATMKILAIVSVYRNTIYVTGIGDSDDEIWKYNVASGWKKCASLVQGRRRHSAAFIDKVMYICGGFVYSEGRVLDSVEAYNTINNKCCTVGKLVHCVENSGNCIPYKSSLYIFGGCDKDNNAVRHVQMYNTIQNM